MGKYRNVIFLDEEGTRLSPYAALIFNRKLWTRGITDINVYAKGNVVSFPEPANPKIVELAKMKGLSLADYRATELDGTEFSDETLILTLDAASKKKVYNRFQNAANVYMVREFVGESGDLKLPLGGTIDEYNAVCINVERVADRIIDKMVEMKAKNSN